MSSQFRSLQPTIYIKTEHEENMRS
jgi:hypothetical protein